MAHVTLPKTNQTGANEWADVEDNDQAIIDQVNGNLDNSNIDAAAGIAHSKLAAMATSAVLLGNAGTPTSTALSGDVTVGATGVTAIGAAKVTPAMLNATILSQWRLVRSVSFFDAALGAPPVTMTNAGALDAYGADAARSPVLVPLDPAAVALTGKTAKLRLSVTLITNATAPGTNIAFYLGKLATVAGVANQLSTPDVATPIVATGSTVTFTTPAANTIVTTATSAFDVPTAGAYMFIVDPVGAIAADSAVGGEIRLEQSWV